MTPDLFYAAIKLVSGEELVAKVCAFIENNEVLVVLDNPITVSFISSVKNKVPLVKVNPWMSLTDSTIHIIRRNNILTMTEIKDENLIKIHMRYVNEMNSSISNLTSKGNGHVVNINDARKRLEEIFNSEESHSNFD